MSQAERVGHLREFDHDAKQRLAHLLFCEESPANRPICRTSVAEHGRHRRSALGKHCRTDLPPLSRTNLNAGESVNLENDGQLVHQRVKHFHRILQRGGDEDLVDPVTAAAPRPALPDMPAAHTRAGKAAGHSALRYDIALLRRQGAQLFDSKVEPIFSADTVSQGIGHTNQGFGDKPCDSDLI